MPLSSLAAATWVVDAEQSSVAFAVKHLGFATVHGTFAEFEGTLGVSEDLAASTVAGSVAVDSLDAGEEARDAFLRSEQFFDAQSQPRITFASTRVEPAGERVLRITGDLTMHGITRELQLDAVVRDAGHEQFLVLDVTCVVKRSDFGLKFSQGLGGSNALVGDKVDVTLAIVAALQCSPHD